MKYRHQKQTVCSLQTFILCSRGDHNEIETHLKAKQSSLVFFLAKHELKMWSASFKKKNHWFLLIWIKSVRAKNWYDEGEVQMNNFVVTNIKSGNLFTPDKKLLFQLNLVPTSEEGSELLC